MTWKEFKDAVEAEGVTDDMEIQYMDFRCSKASQLKVQLPEEGTGYYAVAVW